ncbi:MAG: DUF6785 family protein [Capsulimonadales bacterium]|nr:DUF6785 family protein [Capsulimonadales bacterium]
MSSSVTRAATPTPADASSAGGSGPIGVTGRALLLGLLGAVQIALLQVMTKVRPMLVVPPWTSGPYPSWYSLLPGAVFYLFLIALVNTPLRRFRPRWALLPGEMAVIFGMTTIAGAIAAMDETLLLFPLHLFPFRGAQFEETVEIRRHIPTWMVPQSPSIVEPYYLGNRSFLSPEILSAWVVPLLCWLAYLLALGTTMWSWNVLLRRRWMDNDRLGFPNVQLPMEICRNAGFDGPLRERAFFLGFGIAAAIESAQALHELVPNVPFVPLHANFSGVLSGMPHPWNALAPVELTWSALHVGLCYFIPTDILLSGGVFQVFRKGLEVFGRLMGWRELGWDAAGFPQARSQAAGAWLVLFIVLIRAEWGHLRGVFRDAFGGTSERNADGEEPGSYRMAARLLVAGTVFLILFSVAGGMSPLIAILYYALFQMLNITATRVYCQVGPPTLELYFLDPQSTLASVFGSRLFDHGSATHLGLLYWLSRTNSGHPMAHQMSALYVARESGLSLRRFGKWILVAFMAGAAAALLFQLHFAYAVGEDQWREGGWREAGAPGLFNRVREWMETPRGPDPLKIGFMALGGAITAGLATAQHFFPGFPLHPIGFALAMCFGVEYTWPTFLLMWMVKSMILRYGGGPAYRRGIPFFLGLTLGGLVVPVLWNFVAALLDTIS